MFRQKEASNYELRKLSLIMSEPNVDADYREECINGLTQKLALVYPDLDCTELAQELLDLFLKPDPSPPSNLGSDLWDQQDCFVITYGDSIKKEGENPLKTLNEFLVTRLQTYFSGIHILPFFPFTSDDGFAISGFRSVRDDLGDWDDISAIAENFRLMADLVINHCSAEHPWFQEFCKGKTEYGEHFIEVTSDQDLSHVTRPRTSPLLKPVQTESGVKYVWCTFSHDQIDLNFGNPKVLKAMAGVLAHYLSKGIRVVRLDAIAYLWKDLETNCVNLPQTHEVVRILRTLVDAYQDHVLLLTETNVPNHENLSYFGNGNEAHIIYNFSLPPLLLHALLAGHCRHLKAWMMSMPPAQQGTAYFNFIASHDGIGLRPAEGLLEDQEMRTLVETMEQMGGSISWRASQGGMSSPYEINIGLFDALRATFESGVDEWHYERFICAHAILLAMEGIPAIYIHSLFGTPNDHEKVKATGHKRSINRHQWDLPQLNALIDEPSSIHSRIFKGVLNLIAIRRRQPAFHPNATQFTLHLGDQVFAFWRQSIRRDQSIFCLNNVSDQFIEVQLRDINLISTDSWKDLILDKEIENTNGTLVLCPYQTAWLTNAVY